jgi:NAD(P)-dependent dehydrogenase (short-subunit alcohol dehydrogenase family)
MVGQGHRLVIEAWDRDKYLAPLSYYLSKTTINRMVYGMALELRKHDITAVALSPGWMRTDSIESSAPDTAVPMIDTSRTAFCSPVSCRWWRRTTPLWGSTDL